MEKIKQAVYEAIGAASMCWSETPKGVFDSTKANKIGEDLISKLYPCGQKKQLNRNNMKKQIEFDFEKWGQDGISVYIDDVQMATLHKNPFMLNSYYGISAKNGEDIMWCNNSTTYTIKMYQEVKPREIWVNEYKNGLGSFSYLSKEDARKCSASNCIRQVKFIEVIE